MSERIKDGGPAFPTGTQISQNSATGETTIHQYLSDGISARDYFAAKAMQGSLADPGVRLDGEDRRQKLAELFYQVADAMLAARDHAGVATLTDVMQQRDELLQGLRYIANADTVEWDDPSEFEAWAKSRARAAIEKVEATK